jgi:uncharacterized protein DUF5994
MRSVSRTTPHHPAETTDRARLKLKPKSTTTTGFVDGGWWPRSRNLAAELPALLAVLGARMGSVERVGYQLSDWDPASGRTAVVDGALVHLDGYRMRSVSTVDLSSAKGRLTLLVVPPGTAADPAHRALVAAGHRGNADRVAQLLSSPTVPDGADVAAPSWDGDVGPGAR